ncbi:MULTISPECIES: hypothetical protein [unclassified Luteimonas]
MRKFSVKPLLLPPGKDPTVRFDLNGPSRGVRDQAIKPPAFPAAAGHPGPQRNSSFPSPPKKQRRLHRQAEELLEHPGRWVVDVRPEHAARAHATVRLLNTMSRIARFIATIHGL